MKHLKRTAILLLVFCFGVIGLSAQTQNIFKPRDIKAKMLKVADWQLKNPKHDATDWTNGAFYAGVFAAYETTESPFLLTALINIGERSEWRPGRRFDHADDIAVSQTYIDLYRLKKDRRMIEPTLEYVRRLQTETSPEAQKNGITWWWCDALFMAPPTLAKLSATLKDPAYLELNDKLFAETYERLYNREEHLFARDASYLWNADGTGKKEINGKKVFWSRGNGWVSAGLVRLLKELPANHPKRAFYVGLYREMMKKVVTLQQPDGLWRASLLDPAAYPGGEASGSGFYCYALAWGINQKILNRAEYLPALRRGWTGLNALISDDGRVGWVQPIGADPRRNFDAASWEVYGSGAFLLAGSEVSKMKINESRK